VINVVVFGEGELEEGEIGRVRGDICGEEVHMGCRGGGIEFGTEGFACFGTDVAEDDVGAVRVEELDCGSTYAICTAWNGKK
jgi:hypothetical protein